MRRLAAGGRAGVEDMVTGPNVAQRRRKLGRRVLDGDRPHSETGQRRGVVTMNDHVSKNRFFGTPMSPLLMQQCR